MIARQLRQPWLHFVAIGLAIFLSERFANAGRALPSYDRTIVVDTAKLEEMRHGFLRTVGRPPARDEEDAMVGEHVDREILYREALARGLDEGDRSVRFRLVQKMKFLDEGAKGSADELYRQARELGLDRDDLVIRRLLIEKMRLLIKMGAQRRAPAPRELQRFFAANAEDYRQPARVSLVHVFFSTDRRGEWAAADAQKLMERIASGVLVPEEAVGLGDAFPLGHDIKNSSRRSLAKLFGEQLAAAAVDLPVQRWSGPLASAYGFHVVWVKSRTPSRLPDIESVIHQVRQRYLAERREEVLAQRLEELRLDYDVHVERAGGTVPEGRLQGAPG